MSFVPPVATPAIPLPNDFHRTWIPPHKRQRRTATGVLAGWFEERPVKPGRDALTSLLNGVGPINWQAAVRAEHERRGYVLPKGQFSIHTGNIAGIGGGKHKKEAGGRRRGGYSLPGVDSLHRSRLLTQSLDDSAPPPEDGGDLNGLPSASTLPPTPGPSVSSSTASRTSSKRPHTPVDGDPTSPHAPFSPTFASSSFGHGVSSHPSASTSGPRHLSSAVISRRHTLPRVDSVDSDLDEPLVKPNKLERSESAFPGSLVGFTRLKITGPHQRRPEHLDGAGQPLDYRPHKKRRAARKGWKGWIEVDESEAEVEPPSLIKLDAAPVLKERRTRSGKNFDAIGLGQENWVSQRR